MARKPKSAAPAGDDEELETEEVFEPEPEPEPEDEEGEDEGEFPPEDDEPPEEEESEEPGAEGEEETVVAFEDEGEDDQEGADDSPVIRKLRERNRELNRELTEARKAGTERVQAELPPKPTMADCDYDEDAFEEALDKWKATKAKLETTQEQQTQIAAAMEREWQQDLATYTAKREALKLRDFEDMAEVCNSVLSLQQQAIIVKVARDPAALVYALGKSDARLAALAKIQDLSKFAGEVARVEGGLKVVKRRKGSPPDRPLKGSSRMPGGTDKTLERLEKKADDSGDRTELIAYRKKLAARRK